jgi:hypothetical protein
MIKLRDGAHPRGDRVEIYVLGSGGTAGCGVSQWDRYEHPHARVTLKRVK